MPGYASVDRFAPASWRMMSLTLALVTLAVGTVLPLVTEVLTGVALASPIWGSIYALAFWLWEALFGDPGFGNIGFVYAVVGGILWPLLLTVALAIALDRLLGRTKLSYFVLGGWTVSALVLVPMSALSSIPIYISFFR